MLPLRSYCIPVKKLASMILTAQATVFLSAVFPAGHASAAQSLVVARKHWAYQPMTNPEPPKVKSKKRFQTPIDAFLLSKLEAQRQGFADPADKRALLRRVYYDLIGLPP